jgi:integrase
MAGISKKCYKTKKGIVTKYVITYRDIYGNQHTAGNYATEKEAKKDLSKYQDIKINSANNPTFGELIDLFMEKATRKFATNTIKAYKSYISQYLNVLYPLKYKKLNSLMLQKFFDDLEKQKAYTAHNVLKFCKGAINYCISKKVINDYNVFNELDNIKRPPRDLNHLELEDSLKVLEKCRELYPEYYALTFLLIGSGMRIGEVIALNKSDFNSNSVKVNKQFTADELKPSPKTAKSNRTVYLFPLLAEVLQEHIKKLPDNTELLFPNKAGGYINPSNFRNRVWKPLLKAVGIDYRVRLHDIRGSYIDLIISSGLSGKFAQAQAGHEDSSTTYNIYAQNSKAGINKAMNVLNNMFVEKCEQNVSNKKNSNVVSLLDRMAERGIKKEP